MKKLFILGVLGLALLMNGCQDKAVTPEQLPDNIKVFLEQTFPGKPITYIEKELELTGNQFDVVLSDGTRVEFDTDKVWNKVEGTINSPVPTVLIPPAVLTHIQTNYPDALIIKIDLENYGCEVELANGLELKFNKQGALMEVDN